MKLSRLIIMALTALMLSGCTLFFPAKATVENTYTLNNPSQLKISSARKTTIFVQATSSAPGYGTNDMLYSQQPYQISHFTRNRWASAPASMLTGIIVQSLRNSGAFKAVISAPAIGNTQYNLQTKLISLQQEFYHQQSQINLVIEATLVNTANDNILFSKCLSSIVAAPSNNPQGGVQAANLATKQIMKQLVKLVVANINKH